MSSTLTSPNFDGIAIKILKLPTGASDTELGWQQLNREEKNRAAAIHHPRARSMYIYSRRILRTEISQILQIRSDKVMYTLNRHGKPFLHEPHLKNPLFFNLSHSASQLALAISRSCEVGIDIQYHRPQKKQQALAARFFSQLEIQYLNERLPADGTWNFYQIWCRKEAVVKALGTGLQLPLNSFSVCPLGADPQNMRIPHFRAPSITEVSVQSIELPYKHCSAAVAWQPPPGHPHIECDIHSALNQQTAS